MNINAAERVPAALKDLIETAKREACNELLRDLIIMFGESNTRPMTSEDIVEILATYKERDAE